MTIGMIMDYIDEYVETNKPDGEKVKKASQGDFDAF
jgi:hypothetical protein